MYPGQSRKQPILLPENEIDNATLQLADLANLTQPWLIEPRGLSEAVPALRDYTLVKGFKNGAGADAAPITKHELEAEYARCTNQPYPITEMVFVDSWMLFRVSLNDCPQTCTC